MNALIEQATVKRCAVYCRVSSDERLDQTFNSIDAQREAGAAFIASQRAEGWTRVDDHYEDPGFSGGNMERPGLKRLMRDIQNGKIDIVVVYKIDRLSRSLADFAKMVEVFDQHKVSFSSVTQQINSATSMGRLMLNVLLSFAQFEREVTGERIRDKIAASKRKGLWMGGPVPLGYRVESRQLVVVPEEAQLVCQIFESFISSRSTTKMVKQLVEQGAKSKNGKSLSKQTLYKILHNRMYLGELGHKGEYFPGQHEALIDQPTWDQVQAIMAESSRDRASETWRQKCQYGFLLRGMVFTEDGDLYLPTAIRKLNALLTLSGGTPRENWSTSLSAYSARWNSTDQVPQRLIDAGSYHGQPFGRFDSLDPSDGAMTSRVSLSGTWRRSENNQITAVQWYALQYDLDLYSNFTYALERPTDQFAQTDHRTVLGGKAFRTWITELGPGRTMLNTIGVQLRQDDIRVGLYDTAQRQIQATVRDDQVRQSMLGVYGQNEISWNSWLRTIAGLRADQLNVNVTSHSLSENSGKASAFKLSPKMSFIFGPWNKTEFFLNTGQGFHSNDARGMTARVDPKTGLPIDRVPGLVSSRGQEVGVKTEVIPNLQSTLALWRLDFDSELVYVGDAGNTEAGRPSKRTGIEWSNHWTPGEHFLMDVNLAWTKPRYADDDPAGHSIVNATQRVANLTFALRNLGPWSGSLGVRYIGSAPLIENNSVRSSSSLTTNLRVTRKISNDITLGLDVLNLADRKNNDISYYYTSRVAGEPLAGVDGVHVHPAEPRTIRLTARVQF